MRELLTDANGKLSSKRGMAIVAFLLVCLSVVLNLTKHTTLDPNLLNFLEVTILGLSGASTVENMAATKKPTA